MYIDVAVAFLFFPQQSLIIFNVFLKSLFVEFLASYLESASTRCYQRLPYDCLWM